MSVVRVQTGLRRDFYQLSTVRVDWDIPCGQNDRADVCTPSSQQAP